MTCDEEGLAQQAWRDHAGSGQGAAPDAIRRLFTTGTIDPVLVNRRTEELRNAYLDEVDKRKARQAGVIANRSKTDTYDMIKPKIDAIWAEPFPEKDTYERYGKLAGTDSDEFAQPILFVRDNPLASYAHPSSAAQGSLTLPALFTTQAPDSAAANKPSEGG